MNPGPLVWGSFRFRLLPTPNAAVNRHVEIREWSKALDRAGFARVSQANPARLR